MLQGLNTALTALYASQKRIETTGNNIANVNTEGYTRQRVDTVPTGYGQAGFWSQSTINVGAGTTIEDIKRVRDQFLEDQALDATSKGATTTANASALSQLEDAFGEPSDTGLSNSFKEFFASWGQTNAAGNESSTSADKGQGALASVVGEGTALASRLNDLAGALSQLQKNQSTSLSNDVSSINAIANQIAGLNKAISKLNNTQGDTNNLLDQRDLLVRQLSGLTNVTATQNDGGQMLVTINGAVLVSGDRAQQLAIDDSGTPTTVRFQLSDGTLGNVANITGGSVGGTLSTINGAIPAYMAKLDDVAAKLASTVNAIHEASYDSYGNAGKPFFVGTTAAGIAVNADLVADSGKLAISSTNVSGAADNDGALAIAGLANNQSNTTPVGAYTSMISQLGTDSSIAQNQSKVQDNVVKSAVANRDSVSGVNIDEEMTNLINFQHSYSAAAKYISTLQQVMDTLMNMVR